jgi:hypothetical protein
MPFFVEKCRITVSLFIGQSLNDLYIGNILRTQKPVINT